MTRFSLILTFLVVIAIATADKHKIFYKSLQQAAYECDRYEGSGHCHVRCTTLVTRDWNDRVGLSSAYDRYFQPDPNDQCNVNRTQACLRTKVFTIPPLSPCERASESVKCYLDQFGEINTTAAQFVRFTSVQDRQIVLECAAILGYSMDQLDKLLRDWEFKRMETRCLYRCFLIRSGLYSDADGLAMPRLYVMCGGYEESFYQRVEQCVTKVRQEVPCDDKCTLAQRMAIECIGADYQVGDIGKVSINRAVDGARINNINLSTVNSAINASNTETRNTLNIIKDNSDTVNYGDVNTFDAL